MRGNRGVACLALLLVGALAIGLVASASALGGGTAGAPSLSKCLSAANKIKNRTKRRRAKRRCRKKFATPKATSLVRATLTWDSNPPGSGTNIDLDLWVFDSNGNKARAAADTIPNTSFSANAVTAPGRETFTDLAYTNPGGRNFSFGVCYQDGGSQHTIYNLDYVTADGAHHTASREYGSDGAFDSFNGGAPIPSHFCKAP